MTANELIAQIEELKKISACSQVRVGDRKESSVEIESLLIQGNVILLKPGKTKYIEPGGANA